MRQNTARFQERFCTPFFNTLLASVPRTLFIKPMLRFEPASMPLVLVLAFLFCAGALCTGLASEWLYVGTYTGPKSKGIYVCQFDSSTGNTTPLVLTAETKSPSFLAFHPDGRHLYAVGEATDLDGRGTGSVSAFEINAADGGLTFLGQQSSGGNGPCHLSVDKTGHSVLVANYGNGSVAALPIGKNGALGPPTTVIQHEGSSIDRERQSGPHAHFILPSPDNRFALACDLGLDKVLVYKFDAKQASLAPAAPPFVSVKPGSGPRH